jgi:hypothetical protein
MLQGYLIQGKLFDFSADVITGAPAFALAWIQLLPCQLRESAGNIQNTLQYVRGCAACRCRSSIIGERMELSIWYLLLYGTNPNTNQEVKKDHT